MLQTILVTGATSDIGRACVHHFANQGWNIVATMRNPDDGADLAEHPDTLVAQLDLLDSESPSARTRSVSHPRHCATRRRIDRAHRTMGRSSV